MVTEKQNQKNLLRLGNSQILLLCLLEMQDSALINYAHCYACETHYLETQWLKTMAPSSSFSIFFSGWPGIQNGHNGDFFWLGALSSVPQVIPEMSIFSLRRFNSTSTLLSSGFHSLKKKCKHFNHYFQCKELLISTFFLQRKDGIWF